MRWQCSGWKGTRKWIWRRHTGWSFFNNFFPSLHCTMCDDDSLFEGTFTLNFGMSLVFAYDFGTKKCPLEIFSQDFFSHSQRPVEWMSLTLTCLWCGLLLVELDVSGGDLGVTFPGGPFVTLPHGPVSHSSGSSSSRAINVFLNRFSASALTWNFSYPSCRRIQSPSIFKRSIAILKL